MQVAAIIAMVNALTGVITQLLVQAQRDGVDVNVLLLKYEDAHAEAMAYTPIPTTPPISGAP